MTSADSNMFLLIPMLFRHYIYVTKYRGSGSGFPADNICLLRLAEMHLIRAESDVNMWQELAEAYDSYNAIVNRAWGKTVNQTVLANNLLDSIQVEHRRELCFEGDRFHNLQRYAAKC